MSILLLMKSNSSVIIQNYTLAENNVLLAVYAVLRMSSIQLNNVTFTQNNFELALLYLSSNSSAITQNNTLTENSLSCYVYYLRMTSTIQLNDVAFTRNNIK